MSEGVSRSVERRLSVQISEFEALLKQRNVVEADAERLADVVREQGMKCRCGLWHIGDCLALNGWAVCAGESQHQRCHSICVAAREALRLHQEQGK